VSPTSKKFLEKQLRHKAGEAIHDYSMIRQGDKVLVAVSGGKDSIVMIKVLDMLRKSSPVEFEIIPVHIKTGFELDFDRISFWIKKNLKLEVLIHDGQISEILSAISDPEKSACALCSRLRRGKLYAVAEEMGISSIALGHHMDDIIETFMLRNFYTGQIGAMSPSRYSNDGRNRVIRPLAYCTGDLVNNYFRFLDVIPVGVSCPKRPDSKREFIRAVISSLEKKIPSIKYSIFASLSNVDMKSLCLKGNDYADPHRS
jgi:tRNA 2-thiocytidine biosynthesis protein TtcA